MKSLNALVVDDEPLARERLSRLLREAECTVVGELGDGLALLQWLQQPYDLDVIFMDIQMPGPNGMEVLAEIPTCPPVVFVTAHSLSLIHISEPTRRTPISYAVFCL